MRTQRLISALTLTTLMLVACGAATPTAEPADEPTATAAAPLPDLILTTDRALYDRSNAEINLTLANHTDETVYLPICGPWRVVLADADTLYWSIECEIDYLGHEIGPGETFVGSLQVSLEPGSYRVQVEVYGDCTLGEPKTISARETYFGEFRACTTRDVVYSDPFATE